MKELKQKTFWTICGILTIILIVSLLLINLQNYNREREGIIRNLRMLDEPGNPKGRFGPFAMQKEQQDDSEGLAATDQQPLQETPQRKLWQEDPEGIMIMDHEVYTVFFKDGKVDRIISHGNSSEDFDIDGVVEEILAGGEESRESVGNLLMPGYCFRYRAGESIVVINHTRIAEGLRQFLLISLGLLLLFETAVIFLSQLITRWIVTPALEAFQKQKDFIADASHELKTPLAVIMASADELENGRLSEEKRKTCIGNISYESDRMNRLILGLLELSRLENTDHRAACKEENLSRLIEKTALTFEGVAFEQGVGIETDIEDQLKLSCSRDEMEKMLSTILDNAVKHSYPETSILIHAFRKKGTIRIQIINEGDPIPPGDRERIFERFYRGDASRNRSQSRYGLGLAIARRIAQNHNGTIKADCENGKTTFEITLSE